MATRVARGIGFVLLGIAGGCVATSDRQNDPTSASLQEAVTIDSGAAPGKSNQFTCARSVNKTAGGAVASVTETFFVRTGQPDHIDGTVTTSMDSTLLQVGAVSAAFTVTVQNTLFVTETVTVSGGTAEVHKTFGPALGPGLDIDFFTSDGKTITGTINGRAILPIDGKKGALMFADGGPLPPITFAQDDLTLARHLQTKAQQVFPTCVPTDPSSGGTGPLGPTPSSGTDLIPPNVGDPWSDPDCVTCITDAENVASSGTSLAIFNGIIDGLACGSVGVIANAGTAVAAGVVCGVIGTLLGVSAVNAQEKQALDACDFAGIGPCCLNNCQVGGGTTCCSINQTCDPQAPVGTGIGGESLVCCAGAHDQVCGSAGCCGPNEVCAANGQECCGRGGGSPNKFSCGGGGCCPANDVAGLPVTTCSDNGTCCNKERDLCGHDCCSPQNCINNAQCCDTTQNTICGSTCCPLLDMGCTSNDVCCRKDKICDTPTGQTCCGDNQDCVIGANGQGSCVTPICGTGLVACHLPGVSICCADPTKCCAVGCCGANETCCDVVTADGGVGKTCTLTCIK